VLSKSGMLYARLAVEETNSLEAVAGLTDQVRCAATGHDQHHICVFTESGCHCEEHTRVTAGIGGAVSGPEGPCSCAATRLGHQHVDGVPHLWQVMGLALAAEREKQPALRASNTCPIQCVTVHDGCGWPWQS
jgi:hypothetical protein